MRAAACGALALSACNQNSARGTQGKECRVEAHQVVTLSDTRNVRMAWNDRSSHSIVTIQGAGAPRARVTALSSLPPYRQRASRVVDASLDIVDANFGLVLMSDGSVLDDELRSVADVPGALALVSPNCVLATPGNRLAMLRSITGVACEKSLFTWPNGEKTLPGSNAKWAIDAGASSVAYERSGTALEVFSAPASGFVMPIRKDSGNIQAAATNGDRAIVAGAGFAEELDGPSGARRVVPLGGFGALGAVFLSNDVVFLIGVDWAGNPSAILLPWGSRPVVVSVANQSLTFVNILSPSSTTVLAAGGAGQLYTLASACFR